MIVIGFSRSNNLTGWLIRKATGGRWNHAWIGYTDPVWGGQWVTHAISDGVSVQRAELLREKYNESVCFQVMGSIDVQQGMRETRDYVNKPLRLPIRHSERPAADPLQADSRRVVQPRHRPQQSFVLGVCRAHSTASQLHSGSRQGCRGVSTRRELRSLSDYRGTLESIQQDHVRCLGRYVASGSPTNATTTAEATS